MVEVIYRDGDEDTSNELRIRKAAGNKDISGDYNDYTNSDTVTIGANEVTMKGNDDLVSAVTWINGDYAYSIYSNSGLSKVAATDLVNAVDSGSSDSGMVGGDPATWGPELDSDASSGVQLPNPFTECKTLEEAAKIVGFSLTAPEAIDGYAQRIIQAYPGDEGVAMMEVIFENGEEDTRNEIRIRKAAGSDDISGDYTQYTESTTVTVGELEVTMNGADGQINLATWASNGYTYSIGAYSESGISSDAMTNLIAAVQ
jgi:hypothetical protein